MTGQEYKHEIKRDADLSDMIGPALMLTSLTEWRKCLPYRGFESKDIFDADKARVARVDEAIHALGELMLKSVEDKYVDGGQYNKVAGERRWKVKIDQSASTEHFLNVQANSKEEAEDKAYRQLSETLGCGCDESGFEFKTVSCEEVK